MARRDRQQESKTEETSGNEEPQVEAVKDSSFSVEKKVEQILASNLPQVQKDAYIRELTGDVSKGDANRVPFIVYANIKKIKTERRGGMLKHKGANVSTATLKEWDEIFKDF